MALSTGTMLALGLAAASAGAQYYNTERTARKQDSALAESLRGQGQRQREADSKVAEEVGKIEGSTAEQARREALDGYVNALRSRRGKIQAGLTPDFGSDRFREDAAAAAAGTEDYAQRNAALMSRIDAPAMQRQDEAFSQGRLATDLSLIGRESRGQSFIDDLRLRAIRRNPRIDLLAGLLGAGAGAAASSATAAANPGVLETAAAGGNAVNTAGGFRGLSGWGY